MEELKGKWALVTGASGGIGEAFATSLAEKGLNLVMVARRSTPMERLADCLRIDHGVEVIVECMDLAHPGIGAELKARLDAQGVSVDVLINNAGYGIYGEFLDQPLAKTLEMLQLNVLSLTELTYTFACDMAQRGHGHVLLVASLTGYQPTPTYAAYAASKSYVLLFGEALHAELARHNVKVTVLSPGLTDTGFLNIAGQKPTSSMKRMLMQPRAVAETGLKALFKGVPSVVPGTFNKLVVFSNRFTPRRWQTNIAYKMMKN